MPTSGWTALAAYLADLGRSELERRERAKDRARQEAQEQKRLDLEAARLALEQQRQRTETAQLLRNYLEGGEITDPNQARLIEQWFTGTPLEATVTQRTGLPARQFGPSAAPPIGTGVAPVLSPPAWTTAPPPAYRFLQPTTQERLAAQQAQRTAQMMALEQAQEQREQARAQREADLAPFQRQKLMYEAMAADPAEQAKRLRLQHQFDLEKLREQLKAKETPPSLEEDLQTYLSQRMALDKLPPTSPEWDRANQALSLLLDVMIARHPELAALKKTDIGTILDQLGMSSGMARRLGIPTPGIGLPIDPKTIENLGTPK